MHKRIYLLLLLLVTGITQAQVPLYHWRSHLSFNDVIAVTEADGKVFAATSQGLFSYNQSDNSVETFTRVEGLSDAGISAIGWSDAAGVLVIGYSNGNIDLLEGETIHNISAIKRKTNLTRKSINQITTDGSDAYLSCGFGIVKLNLEKREISETWLIGNGGASVMVNGLTIDNSYYWAATASGIYRARKDEPNLQDYANWEQQTSVPGSTDDFTSIASFQNEVYAFDNTAKQLYRWNGNYWQTAFTGINDCLNLTSSNDQLVMTRSASVDLFNGSSLSSITTYSPEIVQWQSISPTDAFAANDGNIWIGDSKFGMVERTAGGSFQQILPDGPSDNLGASLSSGDGTVFAATGSKSGDVFLPAEVHLFRDGEWHTINANTTTNLDNVNDLVRVASVPGNPDRFYAASWGKGLIAFDNLQATKHYDPSNSPLEAYGDNLCWIGGLSFDRNNNLWMTNALVEHQVKVLKEDGSWASLKYPGLESTDNFVGDILATKSGIKWVIITNVGLFAFDNNRTIDDQTDDKYRKLTVRSVFSNNETTISRLYSNIQCIAEDQDGALWVGTGKGVVEYYNPDKVFDTSDFYGIQPGVDLGDGLYHPLLEKEVVTSIAVDGGNRKWFGTKNSGAFLFSDDGQTLIRHFNTENSPLLSNNIKSITINAKNGEVFFATDYGIQSYMSDASGSNQTFANVYVFPNPVRETYHGDITIDGLMDQSTVKITDIAGNLVFQTTSNGGRAIWNGKDSYGRRVNTGVYLVFCSDQNGDQSFVTKLLFIR